MGNPALSSICQCCLASCLLSSSLPFLTPTLALCVSSSSGDSREFLCVMVVVSGMRQNELPSSTQEATYPHCYAAARNTNVRYKHTQRNPVISVDGGCSSQCTCGHASLI